VTWEEVQRGIETEDFRIDNMRERIAQAGDLFRPLLLQKNRTNLARVS
jgi:DNA primase